jgi:hypothetical protein
MSLDFKDSKTMTYKQLISESHELRHLRSNENDHLKWRIITERIIALQDEIRFRDHQRHHANEIKAKTSDERWAALVSFVNSNS